MLKASLASVHKNILPLTVAVKSIKPVAGSAVRDELLREAALGALFDHRSVVRHSPTSPNLPARHVAIASPPETTRSDPTDITLYLLCQVGVIGVVTIPRNLPALLILEYCEHGTLWEYVRSEPVDELGSLTLLSFCLDVCSGMHYLSSRRIVHRDVAARNVLVDAAIVCKVTLLQSFRASGCLASAVPWCGVQS